MLNFSYFFVMKLVPYHKYLLLLMLLALPSAGLRAHILPEAQQEERNRAIEMFHSGKFAEALPILKKLSDSYPSDYLLRYFTGASMAETGVYTKETEMNLLLAGSREVPSKVFYYLARYYHALEDWDSAVRFYNRFINNSPASDSSTLKIETLIQLAYAQINPFRNGTVNIPDKSNVTEITQQVDPMPAAELKPAPGKEISKPVTEQEPEVSPPVSVVERTATVIESEGAPADLPAAVPAPAPQVQVPSLQETLPAAELPDIAFIRFQVNSQVTYLTEDLFQVAEALEAWKTGSAKESELRAITGSMSQLRNRYQNALNPSEREQLAAEIIRMERETLTLRAESEQLIQNARQLEQEWWADADYSIYSRFRQVTDSLSRLQEAVRLAAMPPAPVIDMTVMLDEADDPEADGDETSENEDGLTYKVQLGAFKGRLPARTQTLFDQISKIRTIDTFENEDGSTVYTSGNMRTFVDGLALQNQIRLEGVKDAFVIAVQNGKRIPLPEAKKITGEE